MTKSMRRATPALLALAVAFSGAASAQASQSGGKHHAVRACMKQSGITKQSSAEQRRAARKACRQQQRAGKRSHGRKAAGARRA